MTLTQLAEQIIGLENIYSWNYLALFIAMTIEGPVATLTGSFLASLGGFNILIIYPLSVLADLVGDIILYLVGRFGGEKILIKAERLLKIEESTVDKIKDQFNQTGGKIVFFVKLTTGLCWITFLAAGTARMNFKRFVTYSLLGGVVWSGLLVVLGYFFGYAAGQIEQYLSYAGWIVFIITISILILFGFIRKKRIS
jgi:membrane protein DedA with SNARE-associated domain